MFPGRRLLHSCVTAPCVSTGWPLVIFNYSMYILRIQLWYPNWATGSKKKPASPVWHSTCPSFSYCPAGYFRHGCPFHFSLWVVWHGKISRAMQPTPSSILPFTLAGIMWCLGTLCYCDGSNHCEFHAELVVSLVTAVVTVQFNV